MEINDQIIIRQISIKDWQKYREIRLSAFKNEAAAFGTLFADAKKYSEKQWQNSLSNPNALYFLAELNTKPVGTVRITINEQYIASDSALLEGMYVIEEYRNQGIASLLESTAINSFQNNPDIKKVVLGVYKSELDSIKFYLNRGYTILKEVENELIMEKGLLK